MPCRRAALLTATLALLVPAGAHAAPLTGGAQFAEGPSVTPPPPAAADDPSREPAAPAAGATARLNRDGTASAPAGAPAAVVEVVRAANRIATLPYRYGGGHRSFTDTAYDCSGSVSFALRGAGLIDAPLASGGLERWGRRGAGRWITVYANAGHTFMVVAGLRFDTSGQRRSGSRWQPAERTLAGFTVRHPPRL